MDSEPNNHNGADSQEEIPAQSSSDSKFWKFLGGIGLGASIPLLLIALNTEDKASTAVNEPARLAKIGLPIAVVSLFLCCVDQVRARLRRDSD